MMSRQAVSAHDEDVIQMNGGCICASAWVQCGPAKSRGMIDKPGIAGMLFSAVGEIDVNVRMIDMGSSQLNVVIGVQEESFETAMRAVYQRFFRS